MLTRIKYGDEMNKRNLLQLAILILMLIVSGFNFKDNYLKSKYSKTSYNFPYKNHIKNTDIKSAIDQVIQLTGGNVTKAEMKFKKDIPVWVIEAMGTDNNTFKVELSCEDNSLLRIDADEGPFEYEIDPGKSFIPFSESKRTAEERTGQKTLKWRFLKNRNSWEYNFWLFLKTGKAQMRINAETGEVINTKQKKK
ncbi:MAG: hypothetical protein KBF96_00830 [Ignavibacteria bacterium]|nr:hypothetical protein [Ignavibacteria bacterium]